MSVAIYMEILQLLATYTLLSVEMVEISTPLFQYFIYFQMFSFAQNKAIKDEAL